MPRIRSLLMSGATLACALGIGYVMQYGLPGQSKPVGATLKVTEITQTSSAVVLPRPPSDLDLEMTQADLDTPVTLAAADGPMLGTGGDSLDVDLPAEQPDPGFACEITMTAEPTAGAMVDLALNAPCHASERATVHHQGLMFTEIVQPDGTLTVTVPAFAQRASFIVSFPDGKGATANAEITSLAFYDRVAVQWKGEAGLQLHAREFGADYFQPGHVWSASAGDLAAAARGEGGFLMRLGRMDTPEALVAEVYSFPSGTAQQGGDVTMTVEAEVTEKNCNQHVEAQTLEIRDGEGLRVRDLVLDMPACQDLGDFLVLKNLVEDLNIAER